MRRLWSASLSGVLLAVLCPAMSPASSLHVFAPAKVDLAAQLFARCFDEASDRGAAYDAPLRGLAFRVASPAEPHTAGPPLPALPQPKFALAGPSFTLPPIKASIADIAAQYRVPAVGYYENAEPLPTDAPATARFDLDGLQSDAAQVATNELSASEQIPLAVGNVRFAPHAEVAASRQATQAALSAQTLGAGSTFNIRAGRRNLALDLSSAIEHANLNAPEFAAPGASAQFDTGVTGEHLPVFVPAYADVNTHTLGTGVTVPVARSLTANLQYDTQHLLGTNGVPGTSSYIDANNTIYGAQLTFRLPKSSSAISLQMRQYRYQDNLVPANSLTQTNANLNFTIKF